MAAVKARPPSGRKRPSSGHPRVYGPRLSNLTQALQQSESAKPLHRRPQSARYPREDALYGELKIRQPTPPPRTVSATPRRASSRARSQQSSRLHRLHALHATRLEQQQRKLEDEEAECTQQGLNSIRISERRKRRLFKRIAESRGRAPSTNLSPGKGNSLAASPKHIKTNRNWVMAHQQIGAVGECCVCACGAAGLSTTSQASGGA